MTFGQKIWAEKGKKQWAFDRTTLISVFLTKNYLYSVFDSTSRSKCKKAGKIYWSNVMLGRKLKGRRAQKVNFKQKILKIKFKLLSKHSPIYIVHYFIF